MDEKDLERRLQGRTLQVYLYLQRKRDPSGIREIQRDLGLSSPSVTEYQIEKLIGMSLVSRDNYGRVFVTRKVKVKALEQYVDFGRFTVPRLAFYATVFSAIPLLLFLMDAWNVYATAVSAAAAAIFWIEAWKMWKYSLYERAVKKAEDSEEQHHWTLVVPGAAALAVALAAAVFLSQYVQTQPALAVYPAQPIPSQGGNQPTIEEVIEMSKQKAVLADSSTMTGPVTAAMLFAGAAVIGFVAYVLVRYRCERPVLMAEQK
jgi:hypothetical protein